MRSGRKGSTVPSTRDAATETGRPRTRPVWRAEAGARAPCASDRRHVRGSGNALRTCHVQEPGSLPTVTPVRRLHRSGSCNEDAYNRRSQDAPARRRPRHHRCLPPLVRHARGRGAGRRAPGDRERLAADGGPARGPVPQSRRGHRGPASGGRTGPGQGRRPVRSGPRLGLRELRRADHHRRDQAALPRPHVDPPRAAPASRTSATGSAPPARTWPRPCRAVPPPSRRSPSTPA